MSKKIKKSSKKQKKSGPTLEEVKEVMEGKGYVAEPISMEDIKRGIRNMQARDRYHLKKTEEEEKRKTGKK